MSTYQEEMNYVSHLPGFYQSFLGSLWQSTQLPIDQLNLIMILIAQTLLGFIYKRIKSPIGRKRFGLITGFILMYALYGVQSSIGLLSFIVIMYPITMLKNATLTFWISQGILVSAFFYIAYFYYLSWRLDLTTSMMGVAIRVHTFTCDMIDFDLLKNAHKNKKSASDLSKVFGSPFKRSNEFRSKHACDSRTVSFFDYMAYMLFFIHILCGSELTIKEYLEISDRSIYAKTGWKDTENDPSPPVSVMLLGLFKVLLIAGVYLFGKITYPLWVLFTDDFMNNTTFAYKLYIVPTTAFFTKFKYHFGWKCLDLSLLTSGVAYNGYITDKKTGKKKIQWNRAKNINSLITAFPQYTGHIVRNWNMTVNEWFTFYIFYRIQTPPKFLSSMLGDKGAKTMMTRMASAVFHGVYPGFYLFFAGSGLFTNFIDNLRLCLPTMKDLEGNTSKYHPKSILIYAVWVVVCVYPIDSMGLFFMNYDFIAVVRMFNSCYWFPFVIGLCYLILGKVLFATVGMKQSEIDRREKRKQLRLNKSKETKKEK